MGKLVKTIQDIDREESLRRATDYIRSHTDGEGTSRTGDSVTITSDITQDIHPDIPEMLKLYNLDPEEWEARDDGITINNWPVAIKLPDGTPVRVQLWQFKVKFWRKPSARVGVLSCPGHLDLGTGSVRIAGTPKLAVVLGDQQVAGPGEGYDTSLHECVCEWLAVNHPDTVVLGGDLINGTATSRFPQSHSERASGNAELLGGHNLIADYRSACGSNTDIIYVPGNHEDHWQRELIQSAYYGLKPGGDSTLRDLLSLENLLALDKLGVVIAEGRRYPIARHALSLQVEVRHGWIARKGAAASALETLEQLGHSVIVCHTHRGGLTYKTMYTMDGEPYTITAAENYTLCDITKQPYGVAHNWQNGFNAVRVFNDGSFTISPAVYNHGVLNWEDQQYRYDDGRIEVG